MDINNDADIHQDIKKNIYKLKIGKISTLARKGQYTEAFKAIKNLDLGDLTELHQRDLWDGVNDLMIMDGGWATLNPYVAKSAPKKKASEAAPKKKAVNKIKKKRATTGGKKRKSSVKK